MSDKPSESWRDHKPTDGVERLKAVRRACPGMGLLLATQLLVIHNWHVPFAIEDACKRFPNQDWPVAIPRSEMPAGVVF